MALEMLQQHSGEITILLLSTSVLVTLLILVPQLLRAQQHATELKHAENMRALEQGVPLPRIDERSVFAGRTALLVPMVSICTAGTVTSFLVAYRSEIIFAVSLAVWCVAGVVSLAAITGGVALLGRLAQLLSGVEEEEELGTRPMKK
jgi:hypothetical protein